MIEELCLSPRLQRRIALCVRCDLYKTRKNPVPGRGLVPADVLFIGEGPGRTEDIRGLAFSGPTKPLLSEAIATASEWARIARPACFFANLVCCRPCDGRNSPNRPPSGEEAWACQPNLKLIASEINPKLIVLLGKVPQELLKTVFPQAIGLVHPAYILRVGGAQSPTFVSFTRGLSRAFLVLRD